MMTITQIKMFAKRQLKGNLLAAVGAMILIFLCTMLWSTITSIAIVMGMVFPLTGRAPLPGFVNSMDLRFLYFVLMGIIIAALLFVAIYLFMGLALGNRIMYLNISRGRKVSAFDVFKGFIRGRHLKNYISVFLILYFIELIMTIPETYVALKWGYRSSDYRITSFITSILVFVVMLFFSQSLYASADNPRMRPVEALKVSAQLMRNRKMKLLCLELSFILWIVLCFITCGLAAFYVIPYYETSLTIFYLSAYGEDYQNRIKEAKYREVHNSEDSQERKMNPGGSDVGENSESEPKDTYVKGDAAPERDTDGSKTQDTKRSFEEVRSRYTDIKDEDAVSASTFVSAKESSYGDEKRSTFDNEGKTTANDVRSSAGGESSEVDNYSHVTGGVKTEVDEDGTITDGESTESNEDRPISVVTGSGADKDRTVTVGTISEINEERSVNGSESSEVKKEESEGSIVSENTRAANESRELKTRYSTEDDAFAAYEKWKKDHGITIDNPDPFHGRYKSSGSETQDDKT